MTRARAARTLAAVLERRALAAVTLASLLGLFAQLLFFREPLGLNALLVTALFLAAAARRAQALRPGLGLRRGHRPGGALRGRLRAALLVRRRRVRAVARERLRSEADRRCARRGARPSVDRARVRVASGRRDGRA